MRMPNNQLQSDVHKPKVLSGVVFDILDLMADSLLRRPKQIKDLSSSKKVTSHILLL